MLIKPAKCCGISHLDATISLCFTMLPLPGRRHMKSLRIHEVALETYVLSSLSFVHQPGNYYNCSALQIGSSDQVNASSLLNAGLLSDFCYC